MKPSSEAIPNLRNDRNVWLAVASILGAGLLTADAQQLAYDGFGYPPGNLGTGAVPTPFFGSNGWDANAAWGGTPGTVLQVQGGSASYPGHPSTGGSLAVGSQTFSDGWAGANSVANRASRAFASPWTSSTIGTYYVGFLMGFGQDTVGHVGYRAFEMWNGGVNDNPGRVMQLGYGSYGDFGGGQGTNSMWLNINPNTGGPLEAVAGSPNFYADAGATHFFVLKFELSDQPGLDVIQLYLDPDVTQGEPGAGNTLFVGDFLATHLSAGSQFILPAIADGSAGGAHDVSPLPASIGIFDELVVAGDWASVVPEPALVSLLGLGGLGLAMARRKKA